MQELITIGKSLPPHKFEHYMLPHTFHLSPTPTEKQTALLEVFVDDFIGATNHLSRDNLTHLSRAMLYGLHSIYPPPEITGHPGGDSCAEKKLKKEDGRWAYKK
eukprot:9933839-Ditylum_brightwellii.AAC.1